MDPVYRSGDNWNLCAAETIPTSLIADFVRPAIDAIPPAMARQLGRCEISIVERLGNPSIASRWTLTDTGVDISLAVADRDGHDSAMELLVCLGQVLWERLYSSQRRAYWLLLDAEIGAGVPGEIDEESLKQKNLLLSNRASARSRRRLERYGSASFAGTAAEYIHSLWHDVSLRKGPHFIPTRQLRRRLGLLASWYPPARGHRLFPNHPRNRRR